MRKKIALIVISVILLLAIPITFFVVQQQQELRQKAAPATTLSLTLEPSGTTKAVGDEFTANVIVDTGPNALQLVEIDLIYDATKLQVVSILNSQNFPNEMNDPGSGAGGKIRYLVSTLSPQNPFTSKSGGDNKVASIKFKALAPTDAPTSIRFGPETGAYSLVEGRNSVLVGSTPISFSITGSGSTQTTPTPTSFDTTGTPSPTQLALGTTTPTKTPTKTPTLMPTATVGPSPTPGALNLTLSTPQSGSTTSDTTPTISGQAKPGSVINIVFSPGGMTGTVTADASGNWTYTPTQNLGNGTYTVVITANDLVSGQSQPLTMVVTIGTSTTTPTKTPTPTTVVTQTTETPTPDVPVTGTIETTIVIALIGAILLLGGAALPIFLH